MSLIKNILLHNALPHTHDTLIITYYEEVLRF